MSSGICKSYFVGIEPEEWWLAFDKPGHNLYVFLSYASADRERALQIANLREARGVSVWIDRKTFVRRRSEGVLVAG